ncbi:MAG: DUF554 domain-containing protein [Brevinemataceae bacterium]
MFGTFINVAAIIVGTIIGSIIGKNLKKKYSSSSIQILGLNALSLGISWIAKNLPNSQYPLLFIFSMVIGNLMGTFLRLDERTTALQSKNSFIKIKPGLIQGLVSAVLLFCLGTMSILGPINAALNKDYTLLFTNASLDGVASIVFASQYGLGIMLAAVILFIWQGSIYYSAHLIAPYVTDIVFTEIGIIGGILLTATGLNILTITKFKVLNMLPAVFIAALCAAFLEYFQK